MLRTREEFAEALSKLPGVHLPSVEDMSYDVFRAIPGDARHKNTFLLYMVDLGFSEDAEQVYQSLLHRSHQGRYYYISRGRPLAFLGVRAICERVGARYQYLPMSVYEDGAHEALVTTAPLLESDMYGIELWPPTDEQMAKLVRHKMAESDSGQARNVYWVGGDK